MITLLEIESQTVRKYLFGYQRSTINSEGWEVGNDIRATRTISKANAWR